MWTGEFRGWDRCQKLVRDGAEAVGDRIRMARWPRFVERGEESGGCESFGDGARGGNLQGSGAGGEVGRGRLRKEEDGIRRVRGEGWSGRGTVGECATKGRVISRRRMNLEHAG